MNAEHEDIVATLANKVVTVDLDVIKNNMAYRLLEALAQKHPEYYDSLEDFTFDDICEYCDTHGSTDDIWVWRNIYKEILETENRLILYSTWTGNYNQPTGQITKIRLILE
jgi:hypothetical protein